MFNDNYSLFNNFPEIIYSEATEPLVDFLPSSQFTIILYYPNGTRECIRNVPGSCSYEGHVLVTSLITTLRSMGALNDVFATCYYRRSSTSDIFAPPEAVPLEDIILN